jgi:DNA-directed RNA polymerase specialized sigma24 family protein
VGLVIPRTATAARLRSIVGRRSPAAGGGTAAERPGVEVVEAAARGDAPAFMRLYLWRAEAVAAYLEPLFGDEGERAGALRRAFVEAWRDLPALDDAAHFELWLVRRAHALGGAPVDGTDATVAELYELPARLREVLALRYLFRMSVGELATSFDESTASVERWIVEGLETLAAGQVGWRRTAA